MARLSEILADDGSSELQRIWNETAAAEDFAPLPTGKYIARIIDGKLATSRTNQTPGYKLTFKVLEGEHKGRQFWHDIWLTAAAIAMAKRDLGRIGVKDLKQLDNPLPPRMRCQVDLMLRSNDDGSQYNRVRHFELLGIDEPEDDPFAPQEADADDAPEDADSSDNPPPF